MGCTHEMKVGSVVTVVNAGGIAGGCSFCRTEAIEKDRADLMVTLARVSGALCDAGTVFVDPPERGIRQLAAERDAYRSALCDVVASASPNRRDHPTMHAAWEKARALLKDGPVPPNEGGDT
jgi:hypothetical protein